MPQRKPLNEQKVHPVKIRLDEFEIEALRRVARLKSVQPAVLARMLLVDGLNNGNTEKNQQCDHAGYIAREGKQA